MTGEDENKVSGFRAVIALMLTTSVLRQAHASGW